MTQDLAAAITVALAALYLVYKLALQPALRSSRPDVPAGRLRRKPRSKGDCCA